MSLPKIRGGWWDVERHGVGMIRLNGMHWLWIKKVCFALGMTEKELCAKIAASGAEDYPPVPELIQE